MQQTHLKFLSLGGLEEIGLNCYLYGLKTKTTTNYLMVDLGIGFKDNKFTFLDTFIPDLSFFKQSKNKLKAILITHGHEDHIGAIEYHYEDIKNVPIYTSPFTATLIKNKLKFYNIDHPKIIEIEFGHKYKIDNFMVTFIPIEHSIPQSAMVLIETEEKAILHSGDFKINTSTFNATQLKELLPNKIDYLFCDSTNANKNVDYKSEKNIINDLSTIVSGSKQAVWVTLFSSNIERLHNVIEVAQANKRKIVLLGSSVQNYYKIALKYGYIKPSNIINLEEASNIKACEILYIITGSQGENNSFLPKVLQQEYKGLSVKKDDAVVFLSKPIPGNEKKVQYIYNLISEKDALLYTSEKYNLHVSGHGYIPQIELLLKTISPRYVVPIHGETLHLKALSQLSKSLNIPAKTFKNGEILLLEKEPQVTESIPIKKLYFEGGRKLSLEDLPLKQRKRSMFDGVVMASIMVKKHAVHKDIRIIPTGLLTVEEQNKYLYTLIKQVLKLNKELSKKEINSEEILRSKIKTIIKKFFMDLLRKRPIINVEIFYS